MLKKKNTIPKTDKKRTPRKLLFTQVAKLITTNAELFELTKNANYEYYAIRRYKTIYIFKTKKAYYQNIKKCPNCVNGLINSWNLHIWKF